MRSRKGSSSKPVALSCLRQQAYVVVLHLDGWALHQGLFKRAFEVEHRVGERTWPTRFMCRLDQRRKPRHSVEPCRGDSHTGFRHLLFEAGEKRRRSFAHLEQAIALTHGTVVAPARAAPFRLGGERSPVENEAALRSGAGRAP